MEIMIFSRAGDAVFPPININDDGDCGVGGDGDEKERVIMTRKAAILILTSTTSVTKPSTKRT